MIAVVLVIAAITGAWCVDWTSTSSLYQQARSALERGDYPESRRLGRRLMDRPARRAEGLLFVAESQAKLGQFDEAFSASVRDR